MERTDLEIGDEVAVYPLAPTVHGDPYSDWSAHLIKEGIIVDKPGAGGVVVAIQGRARPIKSAQVICRWHEYQERRDQRNSVAKGQRAQTVERLLRQSEALASTKKRYPSARIEGENMVIDLDEFMDRE